MTGEIRGKIDAVWNAFWTGGIANPLEVIEQITYLLFLRRLDDLHTLEEYKSARFKQPMERRNFPKDRKGQIRPPRFARQVRRAVCFAPAPGLSGRAVT
jgi:type I restriction enzyme M protein